MLHAPLRPAPRRAAALPIAPSSSSSTAHLGGARVVGEGDLPELRGAHAHTHATRDTRHATTVTAAASRATVTTLSGEREEAATPAARARRVPRFEFERTLLGGRARLSVCARRELARFAARRGGVRARFAKVTTTDARPPARAGRRVHVIVLPDVRTDLGGRAARHDVRPDRALEAVALLAGRVLEEVEVLRQWWWCHHHHRKNHKSGRIRRR